LASALASKDGTAPGTPAGTPVPAPVGNNDKNIADSLAMEGKIIEAGEKYKELLKREPNNPALINNYGFILFRQGKSNEAISQFRRALELDPNLKDANENLAIALGQKPAASFNLPPSEGNKKQPEPQAAPLKK
jgi:predicted Zn-dependent protease